MANIDQIKQLMAEIGPALELSEVREFENPDVWTLVVDEDVLVFAEFDDTRDVVVLSTDLAELPEASRAERHTLLLTYNNQWRETGGVRMALDEPEGTVQQIFDISATGLDVSSFGTALTNFAELARTWRGILTGEGGGPASEASDEPPMDGMIRV